MLANFCLISLCLISAFWDGQVLLALDVVPKHDVVVAAYPMERDSCEHYDDSFRAARYPCQYYAPALNTVLADGAKLAFPGNVHVGMSAKVGGAPDVAEPPSPIELHERAVVGLTLFTGASTIVAMAGYLLYLIAAYGAGRDIESAVDMGRLVATRALKPLGFLFMELGSLAAVYLYWGLGNPGQWPAWIAVLCGLFAMTLMSRFISYASDCLRGLDIW
jgi:hypothetical protein